jgi:hypothetical protein
MRQVSKMDLNVFFAEKRSKIVSVNAPWLTVWESTVTELVKIATSWTDSSCYKTFFLRHHGGLVIFARSDICAKRHLCEATFVGSDICVKQHLYEATFARSDICTKRHLHKVTFARSNICAKQHLHKVASTYLELALPAMSHLSRQAGLAAGRLNWGGKALS